MDWNSASQPPSGTPYLVGLPHDHEQMGHMLRNRYNPNIRTRGGGGGEEGSFGVKGLPSVYILHWWSASMSHYLLIYKDENL